MLGWEALGTRLGNPATSAVGRGADKVSTHLLFSMIATKFKVEFVKGHTVYESHNVPEAQETVNLILTLNMSWYLLLTS